MPTTPVAEALPIGAGSVARSPRRRERRKIVTALIFLAPALVLLGALVGYPVIYTVIRSFYDASGSNFLGLGNYFAMFTDPDTFTVDPEQHHLGDRGSGDLHHPRPDLRGAD